MDPACAQVPGWVGPDYSAAIQEEDVTFAFGVAVRWRLLSTVTYCYLLLSTHTIYTVWAGCWACCAAWASPCCCGPACHGLTPSSAAPASWSDHYIYTISTLSTLYQHVQVSLPILIGGVLIARNMILPSFIIICLGMIFLNFNWSVSVDMTMWVT